MDINKLNIKVKYDGSWPNLCSGHLEVWVNGVYYDFGNYRLLSGGCVYFNSDMSESFVETGFWKIHNWPEDFPEEYKELTLEAINCEIPHGCCGGCI